MSVLLAIAVMLLGSEVYLGSALREQNARLSESVRLSQDLAEANLRTLSQVQRELLRLVNDLEEPDVSREEMDLQLAFVTQRLHEARLPAQRVTLGSDQLYARIGEAAETWDHDLHPLLVTWLDNGRVEDLRPHLVDRITALELTFNDLVSAAENNRRADARNSLAVAADALDSAGRLRAVLAVSFVGFLIVVLAGIRQWVVFDRERTAASDELTALHDEARKLSYVASSTDNAVSIADAEGRIEWVNDAFTRMTGYTMQEAIGHHPCPLLSGPDTDPDTARYMYEQFRAGQGFQTEVLNYHRDGHPYWNAVEVQPVRGGDGTLTHFIALLADVTERRKTEQRLLQAKEDAERLALEKASFLATMSHEIRTPLNAVIGLCELLLDTPLDDLQRSHLVTARDSGAHLLDVLSDVLSYSSLEAGTVELQQAPFSLSELVAETRDLVAATTAADGLVVQGDVDAPADLVLGDKTRLRQVLVNLAGNAAKFTNEGMVRIEATVTTADAEHVDVDFRVRDTGVGIPERDVAFLFDAFTQADVSTRRRHGGAGLGLAISRRLVTLMGGSIEVASALGVGSTFHFRVRLPRVPITTEPVIEPADPETWRNWPLRVLLAEDDPVNCIVAQGMLDSLGHTWMQVGDGASAVAAVRETSFDVVLMDVHMPDVDGVEATRRIIEECGDHRPGIVAFTANALTGDRERFLAAGMDAYVSKPLSRASLCHAIGAAMAIATRRRSGAMPRTR